MPATSHTYHPNHLGSSAWITNTNGTVNQHLTYLPFGEDFVNERNDRDIRFKFTGHERDQETGFDYAHARYYMSDLSIFGSVDPLAEERYWISPYNYCQHNPIMRIDPDGALDTKYEDEEGNLLLETNDGSDAVVTVIDEQRRVFDASVKGTRNTDDVAWNNTMKKYLLGFELSGAQESLLSMMNSDWSRRNAISYWQNPTIGNSMAFAFSEALSQWTNLELVVAGLSAGVAGYTSVSRSTVYRVYGGDAKANGYSWTPKNPGKVSNFRNAAGLPSGGASGANNTGRFVIKGTVNNSSIIKTRSALPLDGNKGGLPEYIIDPKNVTMKRVSGVNPEF